MTEPLRAQRDIGLLRPFHDAGVLDLADVHVAARLAQVSGERAEPVLLAAALTVRALRLGSICIDLNRLSEVTVDDASMDLSALPWPSAGAIESALRTSVLVTGGSAGPLRPLRLVDTDAGPLLYLDRYFHQEQIIREALAERDRSRPEVDTNIVSAELDRLFHRSGDPATRAAPPDRQRLAAALAATEWTTLVAGGPGTGKTYTVARILAVLDRLHGPGMRVALAAPTGKAAAQLQEAVNAQAAELGLEEQLNAMTLHRLLGWQRGATRFRHNAGNRLPHDVVVLDETSMVSLTMMSRLMEALRPTTRLILLGDPDQLTSVDAGAVLADLAAKPIDRGESIELLALVSQDITGSDNAADHPLSSDERQQLRGGTIRLSRGRRFGGTIEELALAVRDGRSDDVLSILASGASDVSFHPPDQLADLRSDVVSTSRHLIEAAQAGDVAAAVDRLGAHRLLCAHRDGPYGARRWSEHALSWLRSATAQQLDPFEWYPGQPLLATANDYDAHVYNGDTGVIVSGEDGVLAAFTRGSSPFTINPGRLSAIQTVYAMTIHRSQGSQYETVSVLLPPERSSLLTRQLLYTAITRARRHVRVIGTEDAVRTAVERQVLRASGLRTLIHRVV